MADTTFVDKVTAIVSSWLQDINDWTYKGKDPSGIRVVNVKAPPYGAKGNGVADDYTAISTAIAAVQAAGGGVLYFPAGVYYCGTALSLSGLINITLQGATGGNIASSTPGSWSNCSVLYFGNTTGSSLVFSSPSGYSSQGIRINDMVLYGATDSPLVLFSTTNHAHQTQEVFLRQVQITNNGSASASGGIYFKDFGGYASLTDVFVWKTVNSRTNLNKGIQIDKGTATNNTAGQYILRGGSVWGWQAGLSVGGTAVGDPNDNFVNVQAYGTEFSANKTGVEFLYGTRAAVLSGCYIEGNLDQGVAVYLGAAGVSIVGCWFNNSTANNADILLGGGGFPYYTYNNVDIRANFFANVNKYGVFSSTAAGDSTSTGVVANNYFRLFTAGAVAISQNVSNLTVEDNEFSGFPNAGAQISGTPRRLFNSGYNARDVGYQDISGADYSMGSLDVHELFTFKNTAAGRKLFAPSPTAVVGFRSLVFNVPSSTQPVAVFKSDGSTFLTTIPVNGSAYVWNDGNDTYVMLLSLVATKTYTVATLPGSAFTVTGSRAMVSDANATAFNGIVAGGGTNVVPVFFDGTNWRIG